MYLALFSSLLSSVVVAVFLEYMFNRSPLRPTNIRYFGYLEDHGCRPWLLLLLVGVFVGSNLLFTTFSIAVAVVLQPAVVVSMLGLGVVAHMSARTLVGDFHAASADPGRSKALGLMYNLTEFMWGYFAPIPWHRGPK